MISRKIGLHVVNGTSLGLGAPCATKLVDPSLDTYRRVRAAFLARVWPPAQAEPLPNDEQGPPAVLAQKARWWCEQMQREFEAGNLERAQAIRLSLIDLLYRLENELG